jgi:hypothetical protein
MREVTGEDEVAAAGAVQAQAMAAGRAGRPATAWAEAAILDVVMTSLHLR